MENLLGIIREANKRFPGSNIVWASIALSAAAALITAIGMGWGTLIPGVLFILVITVAFAIVLFIYRIFTTEEFPRIPGVEWLAWFIAWFFTLVVAVLVLALLSALIFGRPRLLVNIFGLPSVSEIENIVEQPESTIVEIELPTVKNNTESTENSTIGNSPAVQSCLDSINQQTIDLETLKAKARECLSQN